MEQFTFRKAASAAYFSSSLALRSWVSDVREWQGRFGIGRRRGAELAVLRPQDAGVAQCRQALVFRLLADRSQLMPVPRLGAKST